MISAYCFYRVKLGWNFRSTRARDRGTEHFGLLWHSSLGWGELSFWRDPDGAWYCDSEDMNQTFIACALQYYLDGGTPQRKKWNRRWCKRSAYAFVLAKDALDSIDKMTID